MRGKHNPTVPIKQPHRASNCFSESEVCLMAGLLDAMLRGGDASVLTRSPAFRGVARKFSRMRKRLESRGRDA